MYRKSWIRWRFRLKKLARFVSECQLCILANKMPIAEKMRCENGAVACQGLDGPPSCPIAPLILSIALSKLCSILQ